MVLVGQDTLTAAGKRNAPLRKWLATWATAVQAAEWQSIDDLRKAYPSADGVTLASKTVVTVFNVMGNNYRLLTWIDYGAQVVEALEVLTHPEYDEGQWKGRY